MKPIWNARNLAKSLASVFVAAAAWMAVCSLAALPSVIGLLGGMLIGAGTALLTMWRWPFFRFE